MAIRKIFSVFLVILMAATFLVAPVEAKVAKSASKMCCKGHCLMVMPANGPMAGKHGNHEKEMVSCCKDNCLAGNEEKVLSVRAIDLKKSGVHQKSPTHFSSNPSYYFFPTAQSPGEASLVRDLQRTAPLYLVHSSFLI